MGNRAAKLDRCKSESDGGIGVADKNHVRCCSISTGSTRFKISAVCADGMWINIEIKVGLGDAIWQKKISESVSSLCWPVCRKDGLNLGMDGC
jgi:hypothetical protein